MRICLFDQLDLPGAVPFFQTLLALNGKLNLIELLIIDQSVNGVSLAESADRIRAMLMDAADEDRWSRRRKAFRLYRWQ